MRRTRKFTSDSREGEKEVPKVSLRRNRRGNRKRSLWRSRRGTESIGNHLPVESRGSVLRGASPGASHQEASPVGARLLAACSQSRNPIGAQSPSKEVAKSGKVPPQAVTSRWRDTRKVRRFVTDFPDRCRPRDAVAATLQGARRSFRRVETEVAQGGNRYGDMLAAKGANIVRIAESASRASKLRLNAWFIGK